MSGMKVYPLRIFVCDGEKLTLRVRANDYFSELLQQVFIFFLQHILLYIYIYIYNLVCIYITLCLNKIDMEKEKLCE